MGKFYRLILFLYFLFLPFTSIGIKISSFRITIADAIMLLFFLLTIFSSKRYLPKVFNLSKFVVFFIMLCSFSIINIINLKQFLTSFLPWIYALILIYSFSILLNNIDFKNVNQIVTKAILINFVASFIIIILYKYLNFELINISNNGFGGRYTYFTINPNQNIFYMINMLSILFIFQIAEKVINKKYYFLLLISILPILETGSRTGIFLFVLLVFLSFLYTFKSFKNSIISIIFLVIGIYIFKDINFTLNSSAANRAISVFNHKQGESIVKGASEDTIELGTELFFKNPIIGIGQGNFVRNYNHFEIHNTFISILAETGILGFIGFLSIIFYLLYSILRSSNKTYQFYATAVLIIFLISNTAHMVLRERWLWVMFIFIIYLSYLKKVDYVRN